MKAKCIARFQDGYYTTQQFDVPDTGFTVEQVLFMMKLMSSYHQVSCVICQNTNDLPLGWPSITYGEDEVFVKATEHRFCSKCHNRAVKVTEAIIHRYDASAD